MLKRRTLILALVQLIHAASGQVVCFGDVGVHNVVPGIHTLLDCVLYHHARKDFNLESEKFLH